MHNIITHIYKYLSSSFWLELNAHNRARSKNQASGDLTIIRTTRPMVEIIARVGTM
jgi:hypothetical protein